MSLVAACAGALASMAYAAQRDRLHAAGGQRIDLEPAPEPCTLAIVLVAVDPASPVSVAIDRMTGARGFSHCYFDPCRVDELGRRRVVGYSVARGVHWADATNYKSSRRQVRIDLDERTGLELWGCVRARLGRPLQVESLALGVDSAATCVGLIVGCLPWSMQERLREYQVGPCISPNTLATFFRVED